MITIEHWPETKNWLVYDDQKAMTIKDKNALADPTTLAKNLGLYGRSIQSTRKNFIQEKISPQVQVQPLALSHWFSQQHAESEAVKSDKLVSRQPTHQYKQIENELTFFGESFLEGFLAFYGLEVERAVTRYEQQLHVIELQELGQTEKYYYLAKTHLGELILATSALPSQELAEHELTNFYQPESIRKPLASESIPKTQTLSQKGEK